MITFRVEFMNLGNEERGLALIGNMDTHLPRDWRSSCGSQARLVVKALEDQGMRGRRMIHGSGGSIPKVKRLQPGEGLEFVTCLGGPGNDDQRLDPGSYEAHVVYYASTRKLLEGAEVDLESNRVRFTVKE
jgi:hypothetical protein